MIGRFRRPAILITLPATLTAALALAGRPILWSSHIGGARHNPFGNAVGYQFLSLGLVCLTIHAVVTLCRDYRGELPWATRSSEQSFVHLALLDAIVIALLYTVAIAAWCWNG